MMSSIIPSQQLFVSLYRLVCAPHHGDSRGGDVAFGSIYAIKSSYHHQPLRVAANIYAVLGMMAIAAHSAAQFGTSPVRTVIRNYSKPHKWP